MPRPRLGPERGHTPSASPHNRHACPHVTRAMRRATLYGNLQEKCHSQDNDTHLVRACAVEMHVRMSQETSEEPLYTEIYRKNATAQNADTHFVRACAVEMHVHMSQETSEEPLFTEIYKKNATSQIGPRTQTHTLREPAQSKCMSNTDNVDVSQQNLQLRKHIY